MLIVQKYGGTSLGDSQRVLAAARRVAALHRLGHDMVVVVSAQGDMTDLLIEKAAAVNPDAPAREMDAYVAAGEQMSAGLMAMALDSLGIPAVSLTGRQAGILTDTIHGNARIRQVDTTRLRRELGDGKAVVVAGFQGCSPGDDVTTLGRGGSDTTAVALAAWLGADRCQIYTDVDGVYDRDPRLHPGATRYSRIGYGEMLALAEQGAQVLHHWCVELARDFRIPVEVLSAFREGPGTVVGDL